MSIILALRRMRGPKIVMSLRVVWATEYSPVSRKYKEEKI